MWFACFSNPVYFLTGTHTFWLPLNLDGCMAAHTRITQMLTDNQRKSKSCNAWFWIMSLHFFPPPPPTPPAKKFSLNLFIPVLKLSQSSWWELPKIKENPQKLPLFLLSATSKFLNTEKISLTFAHFQKIKITFSSAD